MLFLCAFKASNGWFNVALHFIEIAQKIWWLFKYYASGNYELDTQRVYHQSNHYEKLFMMMRIIHKGLVLIYFNCYANSTNFITIIIVRAAEHLVKMIQK